VNSWSELSCTTSSAGKGVRAAPLVPLRWTALLAGLRRPGLPARTDPVTGRRLA